MVIWVQSTGLYKRHLSTTTNVLLLKHLCVCPKYEKKLTLLLVPFLD